MNDAYNENGDMITKEGQVFRQVGWQINGGIHGGEIVTLEADALVSILETPHGGYSPVYVEVGTD